MGAYANYTARTESSNNAFTDSQPRVWHIVNYTKDGQDYETLAYATDPMDAIDMVRARHKEEE